MFPIVAAEATGIGAAITELTGYIGDVLTMVTAHPILVLFVAAPVVGIAIGLTKKLVGRM